MKQKSLEERKNEFKHLMSTFSSKLPFIIEKHPDFPHLKNISKSKFLLYKEMTLEEFNETFIEKYLDLKPQENNKYLYIRLYTSNKQEILNETTLLDIYEKYKDEDGFIYLKYTYEYSDKKKENKVISNKTIQNLKQSFPGKIPVILKKNPYSDSNTYNNIELIKEKYLINLEYTISEFMLYLKKSYIKFKDNISQDKNFLILFNPITNHKIVFSSNEIFSDIYNKYKSDDDILYLYYSYGNIAIPEKKEKVKIILEKDPNLFEKDEIIKNSKYLVDSDIAIPKLKKLISDKFYPLYKNEIIPITLKIKINDIEIKDDDNFLYLFNKYKNKDDNIFYLYYYSSFDLYINEFKYKNKYTLEERKIKYKEFQDKYPNKIFIILEKQIEKNKNKDNNIDENFILIFEPNKQIDSIKIRLWNKIGKPFMKIELVNDKNKPILDDINKIIDLYNKYKNNEDNFLYLFYRCLKPYFNDENYGNGENLKSAKKIFLLFKRIPFVFKPGPNFKTFSKPQNVFLPYKDKESTFNDIKSDKKYKYYIDYPNKIVSSNEKLVDFYLKNKNEKDDYLYLIMDNY